jgi:hypothetical protein
VALLPLLLPPLLLPPVLIGKSVPDRLKTRYVKEDFAQKILVSCLAHKRSPLIFHGKDMLT